MERTGDNICSERHYNRVVTGAGGEALEVCSVVISASSMEAKD